MPSRGTSGADKSSSCALRALNICDGHTVAEHDGGLTSCFCVSEELAEEVGWYGAAESAARQRRAELAAQVLHPSTETKS